MKTILLSAALLCYASAASAQALQVNGGPSTSAQITVSTITTIKIVSNNAVRATNITQVNVNAAGTTVVTLEYGTKTTNECDTGTTVLSGPWSLTATGSSMVVGNGEGSVWVVPAGKDICLVNSAAIQVGGSISYNYQTGSL